MKLYVAAISAIAACLVAFSAPVRAQEPDPEWEQMQTDLRKYIDSEMEKYESILNLEYWQVFYMDSIMTHDYSAMQQELLQLKKAKYGNMDEYSKVQDKWNEQMYQSIKKVLDQKQWAKYEKGPVGRAKKERDKRKKFSEGK